MRGRREVPVPDSSLNLLGGDLAKASHHTSDEGEYDVDAEAGEAEEEPAPQGKGAREERERE